MSHIHIVSLIDAAHGGAIDIYGHTRDTCGLLIQSYGVIYSLDHPIFCKNHKQRFVSYSDVSANIVALANADVRSYDLKVTLKFTHRRLKHELFLTHVTFSKIPWLFKKRRNTALNDL